MDFSGSRKFFSPRLVDYIAIVGTRSPSDCASAQVPELLRRYPPEDHKDFPLSPDIVFFCQPEGCCFVKAKRSVVRETNSFVFTLTEKDANRVRYGVVINFYRPHESRRLASASPSAHPSPTPTPRPSPTPAIDESTFRTTSLRQPTPVDRSAADSPSSLSTRRPANLSSLTSICLISHHPFFSTFRECLFILKQLIDVCSEKNFSRKSPTSRHARRSASGLRWSGGLLTESTAAFDAAFVGTGSGVC